MQDFIVHKSDLQLNFIQFPNDFHHKHIHTQRFILAEAYNFCALLNFLYNIHHRFPAFPVRRICKKCSRVLQKNTELKIWQGSQRRPINCYFYDEQNHLSMPIKLYRLAPLDISTTKTIILIIQWSNDQMCFLNNILCIVRNRQINVYLYSKLASQLK